MDDDSSINDSEERFDANDLKTNADLVEVLARVDERTRRTNNMLERVIENRINPLEQEVGVINRRSRLNQIILSAISTLLGIIFAWWLGIAGAAPL